MHAVAITAYTDFVALRRLVDTLASYGFLITVHVDKKSKYTEGELRYLQTKCALVLQKYSISWGHYNHLLAMLDLVSHLVRDDRVRYVHTVSGQDTVAADPETFDKICDGKAYMSLTASQDLPASITNWYQLGDPFWWWSGLPGYGTLRDTMRKLQLRTGYRRRKIRPYSDIYKGVLWVSIPVEMCKRCLGERQFLKSLRSVEIPEEFFFQTVLMNSEFKDRLVANNLRYTDWSMRNGNNPAILDESDLQSIQSSGCLFARKIDSQISGGLIDALLTERSETSGARKPDSAGNS